MGKSKTLKHEVRLHQGNSYTLIATFYNPKEATQFINKYSGIYNVSDMFIVSVPKNKFKKVS